MRQGVGSPVAPGRGGFSLLEISVVLVILVILAGLAWPRLSNSLDARQIHAAADQLRTDWGRARVRAIREGEPFAFQYQPGTNVYMIQAESAATAEDADATAANCQCQLPTGMLLSAVGSGTAPASEGSTASRAGTASSVRATTGDGTWSEAVWFLPDGSADDTQVQITSPAGRALTVELRGLTGQSQVSRASVGAER